ncbi:MAG: 50S ribosomal protein L21 [Lentimicrobiaceae bacterium]|jgi:large subunit ribosomal protein L21|nr:50S ribosomal protein L21 [Lentimicrobiaceae bacterium]MDG1901833.1 50S ribosomal protein L21 [Bacteroidales bacterium]MDG2081156.1 50S ribosomal protein L21 [Bacteroidales bacterium]|tara:strand:- start:370 stop:681 length:312 start_codon:yes stop_codon:yes gene_type:complete
MYVVVDIAGQQFKVEQGQEVFVNKLEGKEGDKVKFDKVLLVDDKGAVKVGTPLVEGAGVDAQIVSHLKGDKVVVFKKKRRKGYQKSNGFRADLSKVLIKKITV